MTSRFALRFEDGERRGEVVALAGATTTFGRKPGNSVQVLDPSVSGKHAEVVIDASGALLRDLGSTNGTKVNGERISERRLSHGDQVVLGNIGLVFMDTDAQAQGPSADDVGLELEIDEPAPARAPALAQTQLTPASRPISADAGEAVRSIGAEKLARSGKKSTLAFVGLLVLAAGAGAAWWFTRGGSTPGAANTRKAVSAVSGNLLAAGYSFEAADLPAGWSNAESASAPFETDRDARFSGEQGLSADLGPAGSALLVSEAVPAGRPLQLRLALGTEGGVEARGGVRFESSTASCLPVDAWGPWKSIQGPAQIVELAAAAPANYDRARVLVAARSTSEAGRVLVDDVALVPASQGSVRAQRKEDVELVLLGEPVVSALLHKIDHTQLSGIRFLAAGGGECSLEAADDPRGIRLSTAQPAATLELIAEAATAAGGVATTGVEGFKTHQAQFEREGVDSVLLGVGRGLVRVRFDSPLTVRGRPSGGEGGACFVIEVFAAQGALLQMSFNDERVAAESLARDARAAERDAKPAAVIAAWSQLINEHPIDAALVTEAEAGRAKALSAGLAEVAAVRNDVERARFFRLLDLFRQCRERALATATKYAGSEVEASARALAQSVDADIGSLARDLDRLEALRLAQIHAALMATQQKRLAERVAAELSSRFQVADPAALVAAQNSGGK